MDNAPNFFEGVWNQKSFTLFWNATANKLNEVLLGTVMQEFVTGKLEELLLETNGLDKIHDFSFLDIQDFMIFICVYMVLLKV